MIPKKDNKGLQIMRRSLFCNYILYIEIRALFNPLK